MRAFLALSLWSLATLSLATGDSEAGKRMVRGQLYPRQGGYSAATKTTTVITPPPTTTTPRPPFTQTTTTKKASTLTTTKYTTTACTGTAPSAYPSQQPLCPNKNITAGSQHFNQEAAGHRFTTSIGTFNSAAYQSFDPNLDDCTAIRKCAAFTASKKLPDFVLSLRFANSCSFIWECEGGTLSNPILTRPDDSFLTTYIYQH